MGHGYAAAKTTGIKKEFLDTNFPDLMREIENHPQFENWGTLAKAIGEGNPQELIAVFVKLQDAFEKFTMTNGAGLKLYLQYYETEGAEKYDEVEQHENCIFDVDGVYAKTPAGERFAQDLLNMSWVEFG